MSATQAIGLGVLGVVIGLGFGYLIARLAIARRRERDSISAEDKVATARLEAQKILANAEDEGRAKAETYREKEEEALAHRRLELGNLESRLTQREETLEQRASNLAQREKLLIDREDEVTANRGELELLKEEARNQLEKIAGIDVGAAKSELLEQVEDEARREAMILVRDMEIKAREEADRRARRILATAIQRLAGEVVTETTVSVIELPSDEMKGRIIGREGRNIRHLEAVTGTSLIVDDTPEAVSVSSFDPVRREVASTRPRSRRPMRRQRTKWSSRSGTPGSGLSSRWEFPGCTPSSSPSWEGSSIGLPMARTS
jgi:ribonuclease Y